ncbi:MAG: acetylxylan esterase [Bacteroides sp.]|nr:acetylxylan esterase [Bacteroides sp.]
MKKIVTVVLFVIIETCFFIMQAQEDTLPIFNRIYQGQWLFHAGVGESSWRKPELNDKGWTVLESGQSLVERKLKTEKGFGWYRIHVEINNNMYAAALRRGGVILHIDSLAGADTVYVNGVQVGFFSMASVKNGKYLERKYFLPFSMLKNGDNLIAIKFYDGWSPVGGGLLRGAIMKLSTVETVDRLDLKIDVNDDDYIFFAPDSMKLMVTLDNQNLWSVGGDLVLGVATDGGHSLATWRKNVMARSKQSTSVSFEYVPPSPGFYQFTLYFDYKGKTCCEKRINLGFEPEKMQSFRDVQPDFKKFWKYNLKKLAEVKPEYKMTLIPAVSNKDYEMYLVEMKSLGGITIRGYYSKPKRKGRFPVLIEYMGYGSAPYFSSVEWDGFAHYVPSIRGQGLNRLTKEDDFWITIGLKNKEGYYYQGGFCDVVRAIDFVCSRPEVDTSKVAVRGGSQGGALSFVAAALDRRVKVAAPSNPFLSDYRVYFKIAPWPKSDFDNYKEMHLDMDWKKVYELLSYFDIKNLASWIKCPLIMSFGVQDNVCPPRINFAAYNQVKSPKVWIACPRSAHNTDARARKAEQKFIREKLGIVDN